VYLRRARVTPAFAPAGAAVVDSAFNLGATTGRRRTPWNKDQLITSCHVKGFRPAQGPGARPRFFLLYCFLFFFFCKRAPNGRRWRRSFRPSSTYSDGRQPRWGVDDAGESPRRDRQLLGKGADKLLGLQHRWGFSPRTPRYASAQARGRRCSSSRCWSAPCTPMGIEVSSTWGLNTPRGQPSWGPDAVDAAAWTMPRITGFVAGGSAHTKGIHGAAATPGKLQHPRGSCRSSWTGCVYWVLERLHVDGFSLTGEHMARELFRGQQAGQRSSILFHQDQLLSR